MLRLLVPLHRWLGVAFSLPLAMWFATGMVMHFVPFPSPLSEAERLTGRDDLDLARVAHGPAEAVAAAGSRSATRVRLIERAGGPIYLVATPSDVKAVRAGDLADGSLHSGQAALSIAAKHARRRGLDFSRAAVAGLADYDQWTMSGEYDPHRPLYRVAVNDDSATDLYVSSRTGELVLETTRDNLGWNYLGSVAHWIYFVGLRSHAAAWRMLLWWLSFLALVGVVAGAVIGPLRFRIEGGRMVSPFRGWHAAHHWLGLISVPFVFTWMFSGWLSLDDGTLFSSGKPTLAEAQALTGMPGWDALPPDEIHRLSARISEVEWFAFGGRIFRRERDSFGRWHLAGVGSNDGFAGTRREFLRRDEIDAAVGLLGQTCGGAFPVSGDDNYAAAVPGTRLFRVVCGDAWFQIDGSDGAVLEKLDTSSRRRRWLYAGLHRLDFPFVRTRPALRTALIVVLGTCGFIFSLTGMVIAWRRISLRS